MFFAEKTHLSLGIILTLIAYTFFATANAFVRGLNGAVPPYEILLFQSLVALIFVIPYAIKHSTFALKKRLLFSHLMRGISGYGSYFFFFLSLNYLNLVDATIIMYTSPFFIPFIVRIWTKEPIEKDVWWAIIFGFVGIALILKPNNSNWFTIGSVIGIICGIFTACSLVSVRVLSQQLEPLSKTLLYFFIFCTLFSIPFCIFSWKWPNFLQLMMLLTIGLLTLFGQLLITFAYRFGTASFLSPLSYFTVIFTMLISLFFFHQPLGWHSFWGAVIIIIGGTLTFLLRTKSKKLHELFTHPKIHWWNRKPPI